MSRMRQMRRWLSEHRWITLAGGATALALAIFVLVWFQPQKLFIDVRVDEGLPAVAAATTASTEAEGGTADAASDAATEATTEATPTPQPSSTSSSATAEDAERPAAESSPEPEPAEPVVVSREELRLISHHASGIASLVELPDGSSLIRFEDLDVENGPDLRIYLSTAPADGPPDALDDDFIDLGELKGNQGNQNYAIPAGTDLSRYQSVSIWCRRFSVGFAVAPIGPVA